MALYPRIKDYREDNDKTQAKIAQMLGMHLTVYSRYERGERELPLSAPIKLADYYGISIDELADRKFAPKK